MNEATRACLDCDADISQRHGNAKRCKPCADAELDRIQRARPPRVRRKTKRGTETLSCVVCCAAIITNAGKQTCSTRCYQWNARRPGVPIALERQCGGCGGIFKVEHQASLYCSRRCSAAASKRRNRNIESAYVRRATCATCDGPMPEGKKAGSLYCSTPCGAGISNPQKAARMREIANLPVRSCVVCSGEFKPVTIKHAACSRRCSRLWHYRQNRDLYSSRALAWMKANPERAREGERQWREANADALRAKQRAYTRANRDRVAVYGQRRRARKLANPDSVGVSIRDWQRMLRRYGGCCAYCGKRTAEPHMEHVVPLSRGGRHAIGNVVPACPRCNLSKHDRLLSEWRYTLSEGDRAWLMSPSSHRSLRPTGSLGQAPH